MLTVVLSVCGNFSYLEKLPGKFNMCLYNLYCRSIIADDFRPI